MKKKKLLLLALFGLASLNVGAKDFYEFDNVTAQSVLKLFLQVKESGRKYPNLDEFESIGINAADIEFIRSHVRRSPLVNIDDHLNPDVYEGRKVFMCTPMGNGSQGAHGYPTNELGKTDVWTMWNYTSTFGSWNHGFFQAPGSWADAAHKNGSRLMSGQMFFESIFGGADDGPWVTFISQKNEDGTYTYVEPMLNALMYFGHDGIVYNWEARRYSDENVINFHKALYAEARKRGFEDYNSMIYTLSNSLTAYNAPQVYGTNAEPIHELFLNYSGGSITYAVASSQSYAETYCGGADRLYAGVHIRDIEGRDWDMLKEDGAEKMNLVIWGEHTFNQIYNHTKGEEGTQWQTNYQVMQEHFFSGGNSNPANRPNTDPDAASYSDNMATFCGLAEYMPERSGISKAFLTHFNVGNGEYYYDKGKRVTTGGWYNMASQDLVPTYRWLVYNANTDQVNTGLKPSFTYQDAYVGGSSLLLEGNAGEAGADVVLYKTELQSGASPVATIVTKQLAGAGQLSLIVRVNDEWKEYPVSGLSNDWNEQKINLEGLNGGIIKRIGFRVKGNAKLLVGKLEVNNGETVAPKAIKELVSAESVSESEDDVTLKLYWRVDCEPDEYGRTYNDANHIDHFEIFVEKNGENIEVGRTSQWATIASHIPLTKAEGTMRIGVRSVSTDLTSASEIKWLEVEKGEPDKIIDPKDTIGQGPYYRLNYNKEAPHAREDRYVMHVGVYERVTGADGNVTDANLQQYPDNDLTARITKMFYLDKTNDVVFDLVAGKTYRPYLAYHGLWMSGYAYIDWNNDGKFDTEEGISFASNGKPSRLDNCEIVSYSAHNGVNPDISSYWYNSDGKSFAPGSDFPQDNNIKNWMGSFKVPENLKEGIYRMRFKLDWNSFDPGGSDEIREDGGDIVDVLVNVHNADGTAKLGAQSENGKVLLGAVTLDPALSTTIPLHEEISVKLEADPTYKVAGITYYHGYNFDNESGVDEVGNRQWWMEKEMFETDTYTIPAEKVNGNVLILPAFVSTDGITQVELTPEDLLANDLYNLQGQLVRPAGSKAALPAGVYVMKGRKVIIK